MMKEDIVLKEESQEARKENKQVKETVQQMEKFDKEKRTKHVMITGLPIDTYNPKILKQTMDNIDPDTLQ